MSTEELFAALTGYIAAEIEYAMDVRISPEYSAQSRMSRDKEADSLKAILAQLLAKIEDK